MITRTARLSSDEASREASGMLDDAIRYGESVDTSISNETLGRAIGVNATRMRELRDRNKFSRNITFAKMLRLPLPILRGIHRALGAFLDRADAGAGAGTAESQAFVALASGLDVSREIAGDVSDGDLSLEECTRLLPKVHAHVRDQQRLAQRLQERIHGPTATLRRPS